MTTRDSPVVLEDVATSECGTRKLRHCLGDGRRIETVLIPGSRRSTVCVSTQTGCARACIFCLTATMRAPRNLSRDEITGQVVDAIDRAHEYALPPVRNVVFMGMGEPLDNFAAVRDSIEALCDPRQLAFAPRHVTLSTVGTSPDAIRRLREIAPPVKLAWSIHAADDSLRRRLVPTTRHTMTALRDAFRDLVGNRRTLFVEVTLIDGLNDGVEHAAALARFLAAFPGEVRVNVLPMNPGRRDLAGSDEAGAVAYRQQLRDAGYFCAIRRPRGAAAKAACGQLAVTEYRE